MSDDASTKLPTDFMMMVYVRELLVQVSFAQIASFPFWDKDGQPRQPSDLSEAFAGAQGILTAAAQMSKLFWPSYEEEWSDSRRAFTKARAARLRKLIKPPEILETRRVRNSIEHFDERLDAYFHETGSTVVIDRNMGPIGAIVDADGNPATTLRNLDPMLSISVLDDAISIPEIIEAMKHVRDRAYAALRALETAVFGRPLS